MTGERRLWQRVRSHLGRYGHLVRVESPITAGTPDVYYCLRGAAGWVELKHVAKSPKRAATPLRVPKLTLAQVLWLEAEARAGGRASLLLEAAEDLYLLDPAGARALYARELPLTALRGRYRLDAGDQGGFPTTALLAALRRPMGVVG